MTLEQMARQLAKDWVVEPGEELGEEAILQALREARAEGMDDRSVCSPGSQMDRDQFQKFYLKAWNFATDKVSSDSRCWSDLLADKFCEMFNKAHSEEKGEAIE